MRCHKNQSMSKDSRVVGILTGRWARGSHVGRLRWSLDGAPQAGKVRILLYILYGLKHKLVLSPIFLLTVERLTVGL